MPFSWGQNSGIIEASLYVLSDLRRLLYHASQHMCTPYNKKRSYIVLDIASHKNLEMELRQQVSLVMLQIRKRDVCRGD